MGDRKVTLMKVREILISRGIPLTRQTICTHAQEGKIPTAIKVGRTWLMDEDASILFIQRFKKWIGSSGAHGKKPRTPRWGENF